MSKKWIHPGAINSSHAAFLIISIVGISLAMADQFRHWSVVGAWLIITLFSLFFALSWRFLKQFDRVGYLFVYFLLTFVVLRFGAGLFLDYLTEPLQVQTVPFLYGGGVFVYGSKLVQAAPSVMVQYALVAYAGSLFVSAVLEFFYEKLEFVLPRKFTDTLHHFDQLIDTKLKALSDDNFAITNRGFGFGLLWFGLLTVATYAIILIV